MTERLSEPSAELEMHIYGEPARRPDGNIVVVAEGVDTDGRLIMAHFYGGSAPHPHVANRYRETEVMRIGDGDYDAGVAKIVRAHYEANFEDICDSPVGLLKEDI